MSLSIKKRPNKKIIVGGIIIAFIIIGALTPSSQDSQQNSSSTKANATIKQSDDQEQTKAPTIEVKTVTETETIPYTAETQNDASLDAGKTIVTTSGENGERAITYKVTYTDGKETSREKIGEQITKAVTNQVTNVGTRTALDCPNGSYTNSAGNIVCSPFTSSSKPAGATAQCSDGTYSYSQSRRGTCSHHGGVSTWY